MLNKLLKYNLKNQLKFYSIFYGITLFCAIATRLLAEWVDAPEIIVIIQKFSEGIMWAMVINVIFNNILRTWADFRRSMYGDESYLMHTLPVKTSTLFWSKFLSSLIILLANTAVAIISIIIRYCGSGLFDLIKGILETRSAGMPPAVYIILLGFILLVEILSIITIGLFAIVLGHKRNNNKVLWSVIYGLVAYFATMLIVIAIFALTGIFNSEMFGLFTGTGSSFDPQTTAILLIECSIIYPIIIIAVNLLSTKSLKRGFDVN